VSLRGSIVVIRRGSPKPAFRYGGRFLALMPEALVPEQYRADDEFTPSS